MRETPRERNRATVSQGSFEAGWYIDKEELGRRLMRALRTIDDWIRDGVIPYYKVGKCVLFKWSEVDAHLDRYRVFRGESAGLGNDSQDIKDKKDERISGCLRSGAAANRFKAKTTRK